MTASTYSIPAEARQERTVHWHDAKQALRLAAGRSGLEVMRGIRDGTMPPPPMASLIGFQCVVAEPGEIAMRLDHDPSLENTLLMLHGGAAAAMLDTAMGAAAHTMLPVGSGIVTLNLHLTYLKPITAGNAPIVATGRVLRVGQTSVYVLGEVRDKSDALVVHAVGNFSIVPPKPAPVPAPATGAA